MNKKEIVENVKEFSDPLVSNLGYELVDVEFVKEQSEYFLKIFIDKLGGVNLEDCQLVSEKIGEKLDQIDIIDVSYYLEVSSPGLDRPIKTDKDIIRNLGKEVEINLYKAVEGKKHFEGILKDYDENTVTIQLEENNVVIPRELISLMRQIIHF
ncbi:MAG: ribosome maturation factor RimP [Tissierellales bacterium]|nr:ribosome maturation factor RimP [Tissierellales bacterium]